MDQEIRSIEKNDTWKLVSLPKGHKAIAVKWVYKIKKNAKGEIEIYKTRIVAKGYSQKRQTKFIYLFNFQMIIVVGEYKGKGQREWTTNPRMCCSKNPN